MDERALREQRAALIQKAGEILKRAETEGRELTTGEDAEWKKLHGEAEAIQAKYERNAHQAATEAGLATPTSTPAWIAGQPASGERSIILGAQERFATRYPRPMDSGGVGISGFVRASFGQGTAEERAALSGASGADGSVLVPSYVASGIIDAAFEQSALTRAGALRVAMQERTHTLPRVSSDPTLAWRAELAAVAEEKEPGIDAAVLTAKSVAGVAVLSIELLEDSKADLTAAVTASFGRAVARAIDLAALQGGGANGPASLFADTDITASTATVDLPAGNTADWAEIPPVAAELADAEGGELDFLILGHPDIASYRVQQASTAGSWLGPPPGMENLRMIGSAQMATDSSYILGGSTGAAIAVGFLNEIKFMPMREHYLTSQVYPSGGSAIDGAVGLAVFARCDVVAVEPGRLLRVTTDRTA